MSTALVPAVFDHKLVVAISSRALFDFEEENQLFDQGQAQAYMQLQLERLDMAAQPGVAFSLVRKLLGFARPRRMAWPACSAACSLRGQRHFATSALWARTCFCRPTQPT